jgi:hypothetical protein
MPAGTLAARLADMPALTVRQPWIAAILDGAKTVENRSWAPPVGRRWDGWMWLHEAARSAGRDARKFVASIGRPDLADVPCQPGIVAAIRIGAVCAAKSGGCECGRWAFPGYLHWQITAVIRLPRRVPCVGALGLWRPTRAVLDQIRAQIGVPA